VRPMTETTDAADPTSRRMSTDAEIDVRQIEKPMRHPLIFKRFDELPVDGSFILVNNHDPKHLRQEFERDHPGAYDWTYLDTRGDRRLFRIRIGRRTATDVPRVLGNTRELLAGETLDPEGASTLGGAVWKLESRQRQLDSNVIRLGSHDRIHPHNGPDQDVLLHILAGSGQVVSEGGTAELTEGSLIWLPQRSRRSIIAGPDGLSYLSVHVRRPGLSIASS
jgi:uncharacterized protein (DUF2249 family)/quercetin dioxygenase-like cupin family protein